MNSIKQFWALFKFQTTINPFILFMPLILGFPLFFTPIFISGSYHPGLWSILSGQNLFFVGVLGSAIIAPEKFQFGAANSAWSSGTEFLLTRAISRPVLYRSKSALLYLLVLLVPLVSILYSLKNPDLITTEYSQVIRQLCLSHFQGATVLKESYGNHSLISIPMGNLMVEEWHFWLFFVSIIGVQALLMLLYPLKRGMLIFYIFFIAFVFAPLFCDLHPVLREKPSLFETTFFLFAANQLLFWISTVLAAILVQLWCERRFARMEQ